MVKVSFVIPVYKVELYLRQCVDSITNQTFRDIEVILVDDGSPDGSAHLCDIIAAEDTRVIVIHKDNGGLSDARNTGLNVAKGEFIVFVDGDDFWLSRDALQQLVNEMSSDIDFIGYNCSYFYPDSNSYTRWVAYNASLKKPTDKNTALVALVRSGTLPMSACLKLMRRSFLIDNKLFFKKGQIAEDIPWFINVLEATTLCRFMNHYVYAYRKNVAGSITNSNARKSFDNLYDIFKSELSRVEDRTFNSAAKESLKSFLAYEYCILLTYLRGFPKEERTVLRKELFAYRDVLKYRDNPKVHKVSIVCRLFGIRITEFVLNLYLRKHK